MKFIIRTSGPHSEDDHAALGKQGLTCIRPVDWPLFKFFGHVVDVPNEPTIQSIQQVLPSAVSVYPVKNVRIPPSPKMPSSMQSTAIDVKGATVQPLATTVTINDTWRELGMPTVWNSADYNGAQGVVIGHCDTGIQEDHGAVGDWPFRDGPRLSTPGSPTAPNRVLERYDLFPGDFPFHPHGTWTAEIEAGSPRADGTYKGAAYRASIYDARVLNPEGSGDSLTIADGLHWLGQKNVDVINLSLGGDQGDSIMDAAIESLWALGIGCCCASGNSGHFPPSCDGTIESPADADDSMAFGATSINEQDPQNVNQWYVQTWADRNPRSNGTNQMYYMVAPGLYLVPGYSDPANSGTSFAAPHGTGTIAAILHKLKQAYPNNSKIQNATLARQLLLSTAVSLGYDTSGHYTPSEAYCIQGPGRIACDRAYAAAGGTAPPPPPTPGGRKMAPVKSIPGTLIVSASSNPSPPAGTEAGTLTAGPDKSNYVSGDQIKITGILRFSSDNSPAASRPVNIHLGDTIQSVQTDATGTCTGAFIAPTVTSDTSLQYYAEFLGDA